MSTPFASLMAEFGQLIGLGELAPDEHDECVLAIDNFIVTLRGGEGSLLLYASIGVLRPENKEARMARLLAGNYFFAETGGATLAADPADGDIQLLYRLELKGHDAGSLARILENYMERLEYWSAVCKEENAALEPSAPRGLPPFAGIRG